MHVSHLMLLAKTACPSVSSRIQSRLENRVVRTADFDQWLARLKDLRGKARIIERIRSVERGNVGDCASVGSGVSEMRVHSGPGYRIYFCRTGDVVYVLLCGGTKREQRRDIIKARAMAQRLLRS